ncbi:MAG: glycosyltransferase family 39 protein [Patescibacteria group bacterium]
MQSKKFPKPIKFFLKKEVLAVCCCFLFILALSWKGLNWGRYESWNADQMAFKDIFIQNETPFNPKWFLKPPFYTYFIFFVSEYPLNTLSTFLHLNLTDLDTMKYLWAKILNVLAYSLSCVILFKIIRKIRPVEIAVTLTVIFITSAGMIPFLFFLTPDLFLILWMLLSFYFSQLVYVTDDKKITNYVLAGFFVGVSTACKYNGGIVLFALMIFHFLSLKKSNSNLITTKKNLLLFSAMGVAALAFLICNPFSVFDFPTFSSDLYYLLTTDGAYFDMVVNSQNGLIRFILQFLELMGIPAFILLFISVALSFKARAQWKMKLTATFLASFSLLLIPAFIFYSYREIPTRYVLPLYPFLLISVACLFDKKVIFQKIFIASLLLTLSYNIFCSLQVSTRFSQDPRTQMQREILTLIPPFSKVEQTAFTPNIPTASKSKFLISEIPMITGRNRYFKEKFKDNEKILSLIDHHEGTENLNWFSSENFQKRNPDYIILDSWQYFYVGSPYIQQNYPELVSYYNFLLEKHDKYRVVFQKQTPLPPWYLYPRDIDFLQNTITLLELDNNEVNYDIDVTNIRQQLLSQTRLILLNTEQKKLMYKFATFESINSNMEKSQLLYNLAVHFNGKIPPELIENLLQLSVTTSPGWSHFYIETANYYWEHSEYQKAQDTLRACLKIQVAQEHCFNIYKKDTLGKFGELLKSINSLPQ